MKAKEWAAKFDAADAAEIPTILGDFIGEIGVTAKARGGSLNAVVGALKEQRQKFQAVCRLTGRVHPSLFDVALREHGKEYEAAVKSNPKSVKRTLEDHLTSFVNEVKAGSNPALPLGILGILCLATVGSEFAKMILNEGQEGQPDPNSVSGKKAEQEKSNTRQFVSATTRLLKEARQRGRDANMTRIGGEVQKGENRLTRGRREDGLNTQNRSRVRQTREAV